MIFLSLYILLAPLAAFTVVIFFGKKLPRGGDWVSLFAIWSGLAASLFLFFTQMLGHYDPNFGLHYRFDWLQWGDYRLNIGIALDNIAIMMLVVVTLVSALVHLFSVGYMKGDPKYSRFFAFLSLFSFSMLGLVLADNLLIIYAFWELVGLSSYLLIGFWHERKAPADAAVKAFVTNRIGDAGMLLGILLTFATLGTLNLQDMAAGVAQGKLTGGLLTVAGILLFCGAIGKSAQFPLHIWLPDAMEGPTPVSALIHAATMVAAGVYLVARLFVVLTPDASMVIAYIGGFTAIFAATIAVAQNDIKRVLAYSTVSQLGYMIMALGAGAYMAGFFHLVTHAMFKACLFLGSGSVIHSIHYAFAHSSSSSSSSSHQHLDPQDMRNMGGLKKPMPVTFWTFLIATIALAGVPFTSGFLSKDAILGGTLALAMEHPKHWLLPVFGFSAAGLTAFYMFRLVYLTFFGTFRGGQEAEHHLHESPKVMTVPLLALSTLCFFAFYAAPAFNPTTPAGGWFATLFPTPHKAYEFGIWNLEFGIENTEKINEPSLLDPKTDRPDEKEVTNDSLHSKFQIPNSKLEHIEHIEHTAHNWAMLISILVAGLGIWIATLTYYQWKIDPEKWRLRLGVVYRGMFHKWWMDEIYNATVIKGTLAFSRLWAWFDLKVIDGVVDGSAFLTRTYAFIEGWFDLYIVDGLVNLTAWIVGFWGRIARLFQGGQVQRYILYTLAAVGLVILLKVI
ncbi:MAG: NADH-quinone oxidoreductase subunit L [Calditrichaeota bacterium]|nr:NADH-quinone oxidoreductase subunit L [Calditrichota bacterium]